MQNPINSEKFKENTIKYFYIIWRVKPFKTWQF